MKEVASAVEGYPPDADDCTIPKRAGEFNYAVFPQRWVRLPQLFPSCFDVSVGGDLLFLCFLPEFEFPS
jgi:hypothetical protein